MCAVDVDVQEHLFGAIGDDHGTEAADRLCEARVTLFGVDVAVISLVFDGTNTGTLGRAVHPHAYAAQRPGDTYASPLIATSRRPDAPPCKAGSVLSCIWWPKRTIWRSQKPKQKQAWSPERPHTAFWHPGLRWPGVP